MKIRKMFVAASGLSAVFLFAPAAQADITGTVDATITLGAGCIINGQSYDDGSANVDFGDLSFGVQNTLFTTAEGQVLNGAAGFTVQCSNGVTPAVTFQTGQNDGSGSGAGVHAMAHQSAAGQFVTYNLYSDAARTAIIPIGGSVTLLANGAPQTVNVYGRAFGEAGLTAGTYTDVLTVVLDL